MSFFLLSLLVLLIAVIGCMTRHKHSELLKRPSLRRSMASAVDEKADRQAESQTLQTPSSIIELDPSELDMRKFDLSSIPVTSLTLARLAQSPNDDPAKAQDIENQPRQETILAQKYVRRQGEEAWPWRRRTLSIN